MHRVNVATILAATIMVLTWLPAATQDRIPATVTSVVDGDTIKVQNDAGGTFTVRLIGIDTAETTPSYSPGDYAGSRHYGERRARGARKTTLAMPSFGGILSHTA